LISAGRRRKGCHVAASASSIVVVTAAARSHEGKRTDGEDEQNGQ
jgi:hypothetical protein